MPPVVALRSVVGGRVVRARRSEDVPDGFWLQARSAWGSDGERPAEQLEVPVERFLDHLGWLAPACRAYGVSLSWDERSEQLVRRHNDERRALSQVLATPAVEPVDPRAALRDTRWSSRRELREFQLEDLGQLLALPHGANFSVPGAGKTAVTLAVYEAERSRGRVSQMLVVAPLSAFEAWEEECTYCLDPAPELHRFGGGPVPAGAEIVLVNYHRLLYAFDDIAQWVVSNDTQVCLDEAHRVKRGRRGEWGSAVLDIGFLASRRDVLTGTPAPQSPRDLAALLDFLWWGRGHEVLPATAFASPPTDDAVRSVAQSIRPLFVRTTKEDLDLPDIDFTVQPVKLNDLHRDIYDALRRQYAGRFAMGRQEQADWSRMGEVVMYLLEAATNPGLLAAGSSQYDPLEFVHPPLAIPVDSTLAELVGAYGAYETPQKFIDLGELLVANSEDDRKTLVWTNFVRNIQLLERDLARLEPAVIHGGIPSDSTQPGAARTREAELGRFRTDPRCRVLLANPAAMAEGISLHTVCHDAIYLDRTFNAGQYLQSLDRIHRLGLDKERDHIRVTFLVSEGTIDETVAERVEMKATRLATMLDDPYMLTMALPDEEDVGEPMDPSDAADVAALFAHLRGEAADG